LLLASQKVQAPAAVTAKILSTLLYRKNSIQLLESPKHHQLQLTVSQKHLTIRLQLRIKLKGFNESPQINVLTLHPE